MRGYTTDLPPDLLKALQPMTRKRRFIHKVFNVIGWTVVRLIIWWPITKLLLWMLHDDLAEYFEINLTPAQEWGVALLMVMVHD